MVGTVFWCFSLLCQICNSCFYVEKKKMIPSEFLDLIKQMYLNQAIILIRLLWLPGISKLLVCVSFADKYIYIYIVSNTIFALTESRSD